MLAWKKNYISPVFQPQIIHSFANSDYLFDTSGKRYIDFSGITTNTFYHGQDICNSTVTAQTQRLMYSSEMFITRSYFELSKKLCKLANKKFKDKNFPSVLLSNTGAEANENAISFARLAAQRISGNPDKHQIISFVGSSYKKATDIRTLTETKQKTQEQEIFFLEYNNVEKLHQAASFLTASIIVEPMQTDGNLDIMTAEFSQAILECARKYTIFIIADETQTGLYGMGKIFASSAFNFTPDLITLSKSLGGGAALGATITSKAIHDTLQKNDLSTIFEGNPITCVTALKSLKKLKSFELFLDRIFSQITLNRKLSQCLKKTDALEIRGKGHIKGLKLPVSISAEEIVSKARKKGLLIFGIKENIIRISPSIVCPPHIIKKGLNILIKVLKAPLSSLYNENK